ncbi:5'-methylthioadenosine/S-adenosylhomocysteine nucleosidase [Gracilibacillus caseinilyticus]|uniref:5'-methylthioadenosine/S-adenosylhomocysteine nucleosidase n=1 Tax=Gracilibacillus caseinilyticus TaxID=2932256 RepID=A0ABY4ETF6_9BACI|nr:5'-methylthioadenosine/S-adenosylhomocysteine nucleosidase [Gracilibacillus caseinilyticus]UOQ47356.1 5'-methylthioadenosine/S-adenosylhomocysteine nucleosidase [Gracilibacillus caseinilyticus]
MIGIIGAMDEEVELLKSKMEIKDTEHIANGEFYIGQLEGKEVVLLKSGIGKVNAAISTTILFERYQPDFVINTGSAGGFHSDLEVGDLVISTEVAHHDVDVTAFDYKYGQVPGLPATFHADPVLIEKAMLAAKQLTDVAAMKGLISTGDTFMQEAERVQFVREKFPDMIASEMEAAAVAQVCYQYKRPFVIIRALSDIAGKESSVSFDAFLEKAATHAATIIIDVVKNIDE